MPAAFQIHTLLFTEWLAKANMPLCLKKLRKSLQAALNVLKSLWYINIFFSVFHNDNNRDNKSLKLSDRGYLDSRFIDGVVALYVLTMDWVPGWSR